jgi:Ca-activated chloride channel homolog
MDWLWPDSFLLLVLFPSISAGYIWILRRQRFAARYSSLVFALGRPVIPVNALSGRTTIILALDISKSMCMRDIQPTRLDVAKGAALSFVDHEVIGTQVGIVAFASFAELAQHN